VGHRIFIVEDDPRLLRALSDLLGNEGYGVESAIDGAAAVKRAKVEHFDLMLLDVMLPSLGGFEVCHQLREAGIDTPILMLTARGQVDDKITGFKAGADDYLTKPFDMNELCVRVEALIRRASRGQRIGSMEYSFGKVHVNFRELTLERGGKTFVLSEREARLLRYFIENRRKVISRDTLLQEVWGYNSMAYTRTVDVHMVRLRHKVEDDPKNPQHIVTVHGLGYRFDL
jgi:two-component system alkaline phosphatase synthesis response regulator PhoP